MNCSPRANRALKASNFVRAWRRVVDIFKAEGVTNVSWVWNMNTFPPAPADWGIDDDLGDYYPGDRYVDWISFDHYDYGNPADPHHQVMNVSSWLDPITRFATRHNKPVMIAEFGVRHGASSLTPHEQEAWLSAMFDYIDDHQRIKAIVYFNYNMNHYLSTAGHVFLYDDQVNYVPNVNDSDHRLIADSGTTLRQTFARRIGEQRYRSEVFIRH
jgi:beta-mannanase